MFDGLMKLLVKDYDRPELPEVREKSGRMAGLVGIVTNLILFIIKLCVGILSGSVAVTADAVNNLTDSGSSIIMLVGFKLASKPADEKHPFGHARLEYLSGVVVSFIVLFLGLQLGMTSVEKIAEPKPSDFSVVSFIILGISIAIKLWQCFFYRSVGKKISSEAVFATSSDSRNDVIATTVVLIGAVVTMVWGVDLDGWLGLCVALFIIVSGVKLVIETGEPLLGSAPDSQLVQSVYTKIMSYDGIIGIHDLTVHSYGVGRCFASVHCEVPADEDILKSHDVIDNIERDFLENDNIHLVIHLDPIVVDDPRTNELREQVREAVTSLYEHSAIHDFRVVWGVTHSNVVFDIAAPFTVKENDEEIIAAVTAKIKAMDETYFPVITVDRIPYNEISE